MTVASVVDGSLIPTPMPPGIQHMTRAELVKVIETMAEDWQKLNGIYNRRADDHGWCSDYERRQERYNTQFKVMKLHGRPTGLRVPHNLDNPSYGL